MANHIGLDLNLVERFARVNPNNAADHLRHDNHVTHMGLDKGWLLVRLALLLGLAEFLDETHRFVLHAAVEAAAGASMY